MRGRSLIPLLTTALVSALMTLFVADLVIRRLLPVPQKGYGVWAAYPGSAIEMVSRPDGVRAVHRYNRFGFRGESFDIEPRDGVRIIAVGDSFTEGTGVREQEAWPAALAGLLAAAGDVEVLNLGDGGSAPERYAEIIAQVAVALRPQHLIVCWTPADLRLGPKIPADLRVRTELPDPFRDERRGWQKPFTFVFPGLTYLLERSTRWPVQGGLMWHPYTDKSTALAVRRVALLEGVSLQQARSIVERRLADLDPAVVQAARESEFNAAIVRLALSDPWSYRVTTADMEVSAEQLGESTRHWLSWYEATARKHGIEPWLLYFPQATLVVDAPSGLLNEEHFERPDVLGDTSVRDLLRSHCRDLGIRFIDAMPALRSNAGTDLYLRYDGHPTAVAHELVAAEVARRLRPHLGLQPQR